MKTSCLLLAFVILLFCRADARPSGENIRLVRPSFSSTSDDGTVNSYIIGGKDSVPGAWPWQLSLEYLQTVWGHTCGATLLSSSYALCAAHCVIGRSASNLRVTAGLFNRLDSTGTQTVHLTSYTMHSQYNSVSFVNDISILKFVTSIALDGYKIDAATLPDDSNQYTGATCVLTGWGLTSTNPSAPLPYILQQADTGIITTSNCASRMSSISGTVVTDNHICAYDSAQQRGSCNGDSGGPMNCPGLRGYEVAGITSWGVSQASSCLVTYPSVYTRVSKYLAWIRANAV